MGELMNKINPDYKLIKRITEDVNRSKNHLSKWRTSSIESYAFYGCDQWDEEDKLIMDEKGKNPITFNRVTRTVNAVSGLEIQNRQAVMYFPREVGDTGVSEILTGAANWVRESCDAEDEETQSFVDALICGMGWTETRLDYEQDPDGMIIIDRVDPLEMLYDPNARKSNIDDARWVARVKQLTKQEFEESWPEKASEEFLSNRLFNDATEPHNATKEHEYKDNHGGNESDNREYHVVQYQWWEREVYYRVVSESGNIIELTKSKFEKLKEYITSRNFKFVKQARRKYWQAFVIGNELLEKMELPVPGFTFRAITGLYDRKRHTWFGLVELMKDPQRWANKWLSQILFILNTNASGGIMHETGAFRDPRRAANEWAQPDSMIELNPGGLAKIMPKPGGGGYPEGMGNLLQFAIQGIQDVTGVNVELLGLADRNQPAYLEQQRKEAGTGILSPFFNSLRRYHKEQGRVLAEFIINYISDGRLIRITGEKGEQYVPLLKDKLTFKYDIIVDEAATSPNVKERVFAALSSLIPVLLQAGIPIPPEVLDYSPLPSGLVEKWKAMISEQSQPQEPSPEEMEAQQRAQMIEQMMIELQMENIKAQNEHKLSQAQLNYAKVNTERATAINEEAKAYSHVTGKDQQIREEAMLRDQARKDLQMMLNNWRKSSNYLG